MNLENFREIVRDKKFWALFSAFLTLILIIVYSLFFAGIENIPTGYEENVPSAEEPAIVQRVEPLPEQTDVSTTPTLKVFFDRSLNDNLPSFSAEPAVDFDAQLTPQGYSAVLTPKISLQPSTKYKVNVILEGKAIFSWFFTTGSLSAPADVVQNIKAQLPVESDHFGITYFPSTDTFFITIDEKPTETFENEALDWFRQRGLSDPQNQVKIHFLYSGAAADPN